MKNKSQFNRILFATSILIILGLLFYKYEKVTTNESKSNVQSFLGEGCLLDAKKIAKEYIFHYQEKGIGLRSINSMMLRRYSMEEYLPEIGDQGIVGSCVGWATTYYGFTILKRIEHGKDYPAFSPLSIFNRFSYLNKTDPCSNGAYIDQCLNLLVAKGCPYVKDYDKPNCSVDASKIKYKDCLFDFQRLQENNAKQIKMALTNNNPVIVGMNVFERGKGNNLNSRFLDSNGVVKMENFRNNKNRVGGHALCIVGYDDDISGGAFKIVNSWGKDWGKDAFFYLRYSDLDVLVCAYALFSDTDPKKDKTSLFKTHTISFYNSSNKNLYLAVGLKTDNGKRSKGWFFVQAGQTRNVSVKERNSNEVSYLIMNEEGKVFDNNNSSNKYPIKYNLSFDLLSTDQSKKYDSQGYKQFNPDNTKGTQIVIISGNASPRISL